MLFLAHAHTFLNNMHAAIECHLLITDNDGHFNSEHLQNVILQCIIIINIIQSHIRDLKKS